MAVILYPDIKTCARCKTEYDRDDKLAEHFYRDKSTKDGFQSRCKPCSTSSHRRSPFYPEIYERIRVAVPNRSRAEIEAFNEAVYRLIEIFPSKFMHLLWSERVSRDLAEPLPYEPRGTRKKIPA